VASLRACSLPGGGRQDTGTVRALGIGVAEPVSRTGPAGLKAAHDFLTNTGETVYNPYLDDDTIRAAARATAEAARATEAGLNTMKFLADFDKEIARNHGPGSSWNDEERARWETELKVGTIETVEKAFGNPEIHDERALLGMALDDRKAEKGKGLFEEMLDNELEKHSTEPPHRQAFRDEAVKEFEETHDEDGYLRTTQDALGREHGGRYDPVRRDR
jgi:hypothetical protein